MANRAKDQRQPYLHHVHEALAEADAALPRTTRAHRNRDFFNPAPGAMQVHEDLGFRIVIGIPVGEGQDQTAIDKSEAAGAVRVPAPSQHTKQTANKHDPERPRRCLPVHPRTDEPRPDHHVSPGRLQCLE